jgi:hypothetical protein
MDKAFQVKQREFLLASRAYDKASLITLYFSLAKVFIFEISIKTWRHKTFTTGVRDE